MSITAMQVSLARFSTMAHTFVEVVIALLVRDAVVAAVDDFRPDDLGGLGAREDAVLAFFVEGRRDLSIRAAPFIVRHTAKLRRWQAATN